MFVSHLNDIQEIKVNMPGALNAYKKTPIGPAQGWEGWVMRIFTLKDGGNTPRHTHPWPHINYIISGFGTLILEGKEIPVEAGSVAYVPSGADHQFMSSSNNDFSFICIVPEEGDK